MASPIIIFCDGACSGNPGPGGWGAIVATPDGQVRELGGGAGLTTNNQMELQATISALDAVADNPGDVNLFTDSVYVIKGITGWIHGWRKRDWKATDGKDVANREYWERLAAVTAKRARLGRIHWKYVRGHTGIAGNERVDEIAVAYSQGLRPSLYRGSFNNYGVSLDVPEGTGALPESNGSKSTKPSKPYAYLSLLGGTVERHATWAECQRRVSGRSGAKHKKVMSAEEETTVLEAWGINPSTLKSR